MKLKTPCVGVCTATALGDPVCGGCLRTANEVIDWNSYTEQRKEQVRQRLIAMRKLEQDFNWLWFIVNEIEYCLDLDTYQLLDCYARPLNNEELRQRVITAYERGELKVKG